MEATAQYFPVLLFITLYKVHGSNFLVICVINSSRHRRCFIRGYIHELFVSKALTRSYLARSGFVDCLQSAFSLKINPSSSYRSSANRKYTYKSLIQVRHRPQRCELVLLFAVFLSIEVENWRLTRRDLLYQYFPTLSARSFKLNTLSTTKYLSVFCLMCSCFLLFFVLFFVMLHKLF